jgi:hypothetical protein
MPAWTPGTDEFAPFDEDGELKEEIPQELAKFLDEFSITQNFSISINLYKGENYTGFPKMCGTCQGTVPSMDGLVRNYGPGFYALKTSWIPKGGKGRTETYKVALVGSHYSRMFEKAEEERHLEEVAEAERKADLDAIRRNKGVTPAGNGLTDFLNNYTKLAEVQGVGGNGKGSDMMAICGMMGAMMQSMTGIMVASMQQSQSTLLAVLGGQNKNNDAQSLLGVFEKMLTIKDGLMPRDKSWVEEVVTALADNIDSIASIFQKPAGEREADPDFREIDKGLDKTRKRAQADPEFLRALVNHLDKKVGATMSDKILNGFMKVDRAGAKPPPAPEPAEKPVEKVEAS